MTQNYPFFKNEFAEPFLYIQRSHICTALVSPTPLGSPWELFCETSDDFARGNIHMLNRVWQGKNVQPVENSYKNVCEPNREYAWK